MSKKIVFHNASFLFVSDVLARLINALAAIYVARYLGAADYGMLSVGLAFSVIAGYFSDMGLSQTVIREGTKSNADMQKIMSSYLKTRLIFAFGTVLISVLIISNFYIEETLRKVLYFMVLPTILGAALQGFGAIYFQIIQQMKYTAIIRGISVLITSCSLLIGVHFNWEIYLISLVYGMSSVIGGLIAFFLIVKRITFTRDWNFLIFNQLFTFTLGGLVVMILPQLGPLLLEKVTEVKEVGFFAAAYRIPAVLYQIPGVLAAAFYPLLFQYGNNNDQTKHFNLNVLEIKIMSAIGIIISIPFILYPDSWIILLFGEEWNSASSVLQVLAFVVILQSINYPLADALTTKGLQYLRTRVLLIAIILGFFSYLILGTLNGSNGGAVAAIIVELILLIGYLICNVKGLKLLYRGARHNVISFIVIFSFFKLLNLNLYPIVGMSIYLLLFSLIVYVLDFELRHQIRKQIKKFIRK